MADRDRLTNSSDETKLDELLSGDVVFSIPFFQRPYKWPHVRLEQLNKDILAIVDDFSDMHFLGAVILHGRANNPSDPKIFDVIDGQQRITTLFLYLAATVRVLIQHEAYSDAAGLLQKYLIINRATKLSSSLKLHPCKEDRTQLNCVINDILVDPNFRKAIRPVKPKLLPASGRDSGRLLTNYNYALRFLQSQADQGGLDQVHKICRALVHSVSLVQIIVRSPTDGPKIFDSLNSRQEPMTVGDLVRNEIFSRVSDSHPEEAEDVDHQMWQPFYEAFRDEKKNLFDSYFFPYGLTRNPNLKKSEVYGALREAWKDIEHPKTIITELHKYQPAFLDLCRGTNIMKHPPKIEKQFRNMYLSGLPASTYPFLMQLSQAIAEKSVTHTDACGTLNVIESFLVRRAVCGHEPTGLHAVFKRLWVDTAASPSEQKVTDILSKHRTVSWPNDSAFLEALRHRPLYGSGITPYLLREYDAGLGGDIPHNPHWIEHILSATYSQAWADSFSKTQHTEMKDLLGNLLPFSKNMNQSLGPLPYAKKRRRYGEDSMYKSARVVAADFDVWTPDSIASRCELIAAWALDRWPHGG